MNNEANAFSTDGSSTSISTTVSVPIKASAQRAEWKNVVIDLFAGTLGGCSGIIVGQPLDVVRVRMQAKATCNMYNGTFDACKSIITKEGPFALFKGLLSPLIANAPLNALVFAGYGQAMRYMESIWGPAKSSTQSELSQLKAQSHTFENSDFSMPNRYQTTETTDSTWQRTRDIQILRLSLAGAWAGLLQCIVATPAELIKCQQQIYHTSSYQPLARDIMRERIQKLGFFRGIFGGWWTTFWRDLPSFTCYFLVYELCKAALVDMMDMKATVPNSISKETKNNSESVHTGVALTAGAIAGAASWIVTYPFDVLKSNVQTLPPDAPRIQTTMLYTAKTLYKSDGIAAFFRGLSPTVVRSLPANAVAFLVYERTLEMMRDIK